MVIMQRLFIFLFITIMVADVLSVIYATVSVTPILQEDGVRVVRKPSSVTDCSYLVFANDNDYTVTVVYSVGGGIKGSVLLRRGDMCKSDAAYSDESYITIDVERTDCLTDRLNNDNKRRRFGERR